MPEPAQLLVDYEAVIAKLSDRIRQLVVEVALRDSAIEQLQARVAQLESADSSLNGQAHAVVTE
jgi:hypothetical protein